MAEIIDMPKLSDTMSVGTLVKWNIKEGQTVAFGDILGEVETDKAVYPIEASFAGTFKGWQIKVDDTVLIGQEIALVTGDAASTASLATEGAAKPAPAPAASVARTAAPTPVISSTPAPMKGNVRPPALHPAITKRLDTVIPANMLMDVRWDGLRAAREEAKQKHGKAAASPSAMMAWCVVRAQEKHAAFRCIVNKEGAILEQADFELGVAVALDGDRLATAPVVNANKLSWADFVAAYNRAVEDTRAGRIIEVQAPVNLTSLGAFGVESATPIVVPPAMGTLFVGSAHERLINDGGVIHPAEVVTLSLTFDHKVVNGATAASFLQEVRKQMEGFKLPG